nr:hypothetical protein [uncultured Schaedlerella sp.]
MTALDFQDELAQDVKKILKDIVTVDAAGRRVSGVQVYKQQLPVITTDEEDDSKFLPYAIVRLYSGKTEDDDTPWIVTADIHFGVYDPDASNQGHRHVMTMCQRLLDRYAAEPLLAKRYRAEQDMEWAIQDEDTYPYYFGGVRIKFNIPKIGRREPVYG